MVKRFWLPFVVSLFAIPCVTAQTTAPRRQPVAPKPTAETTQAPLEPKQILKRESPGIVTVFALDEKGQPVALGSGFIVRSNGLVVTNYHVIKGAADAQIKLQNGEIYENVRVFDYDRRRDIVILKIRAMDLPTVTLGDSSTVEAGDRAYAIGNPEGYEYTISDGLISARRIIEGTEQLQITVPISHGSSGGPLYNIYGQVIGITSAGYMEGAQNLNFAVPLKYVLVMLDSTSQDITLAQLTEKMRPIEEQAEAKSEPAKTSESPKEASAPTYVDPEGWLEIDFPSGWELEGKPPEGTMLSASKGDAVALMAYRSSDSRSADDSFNQMKKLITEKFGKLANYSEKVKIDDKNGRRIQMQTFRMESKFVLIGALQNNEKIVGLLGVCADESALSDLADVIKGIKY